ncbi:MAG: hypothetical protein JXR70_10900 [Spirochaetales bacterium]|nr:hypothetical protein [Spirochaetales bacterium]
MKKLVLVICAALILFSAFHLSAQDSEKDKLYAKSTFISRVFTHELGYLVYYLKGDLSVGKLYLPYDWFKSRTGHGEITFDNHQSYPYFVAMYQNGKVKKIKLFLQSNDYHTSWGRLNASNADVKDQFETPFENLLIEY